MGSGESGMGSWESSIAAPHSPLPIPHSPFPKNQLSGLPQIIDHEHAVAEQCQGFR